MEQYFPGHRNNIVKASDSVRMIKDAIRHDTNAGALLTRIWFEQRGAKVWLGGWADIYCYNDDMLAFQLYGPKWDCTPDPSGYNNCLA